MKRTLTILMLLAAGLVITGCGVRGDLERPPPLWGPDERTADERAHEDEGAKADPAEADRTKPHPAL